MEIDPIKMNSSSYNVCYVYSLEPSLAVLLTNWALNAFFLLLSVLSAIELDLSIAFDDVFWHGYGLFHAAFGTPCGEFGLVSCRSVWIIFVGCVPGYRLIVKGVEFEFVLSLCCRVFRLHGSWLLRFERRNVVGISRCCKPRIQQHDVRCIIFLPKEDYLDAMSS